MSEFKPEFADLSSMLRASAERYGARQMLGTRKADGWQWLSYADFAKQVDRARAGLVSHGVQRGERVAIVSGNRWEWACAAFAAYTLGAIWVPMYEIQLDKEISYILADCGAKICFASTAAIAARVRGAKPDVKVICIDEEWDALLAAGDKAPAPSVTPSGDEVALFIYTSGTTGNPKGVQLTHGNCGWAVSAMLGLGLFSPGGESSLAILPWAHAAGGISEVLGGIGMGGSIAICEAIDKVPQYLGEVKPTTLIAVPRIWNRLYQGVVKMVSQKPGLIQAIFRNGVQGRAKKLRGEKASFKESICAFLAEMLIFKKVRARFGGRVKFAISGSAALSKEVAEFIDAVGIPVFEAYGMTETSSAVTANLPGKKRIGSVGVAMPGIEIKLDKAASGAHGEEGEIIICGPSTMKGYYNLTDETSKTLTGDGGVRSGDLGRFDADGFLFITGRVKELYKMENGKYVAPAPLEEKITLSPFIQQAVLFGADKPYNVALLVPDLGAVEEWAKARGITVEKSQLLEQPQIRELFTGELARYSEDWKGFERVKNFTFTTEAFTQENGMLTPSLKLKRRVVMAKYEGRLRALYS
jgi:long-chain acyl-CoA synthetase